MRILILWSVDLVWTSSCCVAIRIWVHKPVFFWNLDTINSLQIVMKLIHLTKPSSVFPSYYELCDSSLDQWEIKIHAKREMFQYFSLVKKRVKVLNAWVCWTVGMLLPGFPHLRHRICHPCHGSSSLHCLLFMFCICFISPLFSFICIHLHRVCRMHCEFLHQRAQTFIGNWTSCLH